VNGPDGCEFVNKAYIEFVGVSGQIDVARYDWAAFIHPDDRHTYVRGYQQAVEMRAPFDQQFRFRRHDGQYRWMRSVGQPQISATGELFKYVGATIDITDIQHAQARLQQWNADLERSVNVKTGELLESQAQLRALATELNLAEQRERPRLATDLHDHLQQLLVLGKLKLARGKQVSDISPVVGRVVSETDQILSDALTYTRTLVTQLNPPILREHGLAAGLKWLTESMTKHDLVVSVTVEDNVDLPDDHAVLLFQSVRELLINSAKHSGTNKAWVMLKKQEKELVIEVRDEGVGFEISASGSLIPGGLSSKFGLFSIKERMRALGGSFNIQSTPGQGTTATLLLPIAGDASSKTNTAHSRP
jgi:PAS domain S-box-containing protein